MSTTGDSEATTTTAATETSTTNRKQPFPQGFLDTISTGWAERPETFPPARSRAAFAARRRHALSAAFPGERLVFPAGELKQRSNDTDYRFRAHSAFAHLTGWGSDAEPGAILVMDPLPDGGHEAVATGVVGACGAGTPSHFT